MIDHFRLSRRNYLLECMLYVVFPQSLLQEDGLSTEKQQTQSRYYKKVGQYTAVPHKRKLKFMSVLSPLIRHSVLCSLFLEQPARMA